MNSYKTHSFVLIAQQTANGRANCRFSVGREIAFEARPFEIRTFRVPRDPAQDVVETDLLERPLETAGGG